MLGNKEGGLSSGMKLVVIGDTFYVLLVGYVVEQTSVEFPVSSSSLDI